MTNRKEQLINLIFAKIKKLETQKLKLIRDYILQIEEKQEICKNYH